MPAVWVSTIGLHEGQFVQTLALSPTCAHADPVAIVVRLDPSIDGAWKMDDDRTIQTAIADRLAALLNIIPATTRIAQIQLDYDAPVRLLARWAHVVRDLTTGVLAHREVWVTSLIAHLRDPAYGHYFRGAIGGHILQVFDTGETFTPSAADEAVRLADHHAIPFRLGLAGFERRRGTTGFTNHHQWVTTIPSFAHSPWFRGIWIFPAGFDWLPWIKDFL